MASTLLLEMAHTNKMTQEMLTELNGEHCFKNKPTAETKAGYGIRSNNNPDERNL